MNDLLFQNFSTVQNNLQPGMTGINLGESSAPDTIVPTSFFSLLSNPGPAVTQITPPVSGAHLLSFTLDDAVTFTPGGGNISTINGFGDTVQFPAGSVVLAIYDDKSGSYTLTGISNALGVADGNGDPHRLILAGQFTLGGTNPSNLDLPNGFVVQSAQFNPKVTTTGTGITFTCTHDNQTGTLIPVYAWDKDGDAATDTPVVDFIVYGYFD